MTTTLAPRTPLPPTQPMTPATLAPAAPSSLDIVHMGMDTVAGFEALQRAARLLASSTMIPEQYRDKIVKGYGRDKTETPNPAGVSNCAVALNMALRMGADPIMVMQNLHVVNGRPGWSSQWIIAAINNCGRFSPLRFDLSEPGEKKTIPYTVMEWDDRSNKKVPRTINVEVVERTCRAWALERATNTRLDGPMVSMTMAAAEGWLSKDGSKWLTMPEVMLRYRAAAFFGKLYAPELLMGFQTAEELEDIRPAQIEILPHVDPAAPVIEPEVIPPPAPGAAQGDAATPPPAAEPAAVSASQVPGGNGNPPDPKPATKGPEELKGALRRGQAQAAPLLPPSDTNGTAE